MESKGSTCPVNNFQSSNTDELFMQKGLVFSNNLKELKKIREQLYAAAEYFESSYDRDNNDHEEIFFESLKDYVAKAFISTVDHLGSVAYKINHFLNENTSQVTETAVRVSCIEQRLRSCREYVDRGGLAQQTLLIEIPKYHKQYLIPGSSESTSAESCRRMEVKPHSSLLRSANPRPASEDSASSTTTFSFSMASSGKGSEKRSVSPLRFPLRRSGSVGKRSVSPSFPVRHSGSMVNRSISPSFPVRHSGTIANRSISPNSFNSRQRYTPEPVLKKAVSIYPGRDGTKEIEAYSKKTRNLFKALLSVHKSRNNLPQ